MVPAPLGDQGPLSKEYILDFTYICILGNEKQKEVVGKEKDVGERMNYAPSSFHCKEKWEVLESRKEGEKRKQEREWLGKIREDACLQVERMTLR